MKVCIGAEGFGCHIGVDDDGVAEADDSRALQQAVWDLHFGVEPRPQVADLIDAIDDSALARIADLAAPDDHVVAGHDFYPVGVTQHGGGEHPTLTIADRIGAYEREARDWYQRYGREFWVAETSNLGLPLAQQEEWLTALVARLEAMGADGLPVRGLCWYSRGDQYDWDTMLLEPVGKITEVGLFDAQRRARPVADAYRRLATGSP